MRFQPLFVVAISHGYYTQGCKDFGFSFPVDTVRLLKSGSLIARVSNGKLYVLFTADQPNTLVTGKTLRIGLRLLNPFFSNVTELDFDFNSSRPLYRNSANPRILAPAETITLVGQVFSHSLISTTRPVTVTLKDTNDRSLQTDTITTINNSLTVSYDLTGQLAGVYSVEEVDAENTKTVAYYSDAELMWQGAFGIVEIKVDNSFYAQAPEFEISFAAKQEILKYYVIAKNYSDLDLAQLSVLDAGFASEGRSQINFTPVLPADFTDDDISPSLLGNGDARIALFKSQTAVARQEKAYQKIQLKKNDEVLIPHLPQPGASKGNADLIIPLSKSKS